MADSSRPLMPWLWFWLVVYLVNLPNQIIYLWLPRLQELFVWHFGLIEEKNPLFHLTRLSNILELVPLVAVFLGVIETLLFPKIRALRLERQYSLTEPGSVPAIAEIHAFLSQHMPNVQIRANLLSGKWFNRFAFTYPVGYRTYVIALFGGIVKLWRSDKSAAQAMLLHEIAHCRQGDVLIVGAGSLFRWLLNRWVWLYLLLGLLPWLLSAGYYVFSSWLELAEVRNFGIAITNTELTRRTFSSFLFLLSGQLLGLLGVLLYTAQIIILPLLGVWVTELNADRFASEKLQSPTEMASAIRKLSSKFSIWQHFLSGMSHPPVRLREWAVSHFGSSSAWIVSVLIFPVAYIAKLFIISGVAVSFLWLSSSGDEIVQTLKGGIKSFLDGTVSLWIVMSLWVLVWPIIAPYWEWWFTYRKGILNWFGYQDSVISAFLIGILAVTGHGIAKSISSIPDKPVVATPIYTDGQHFKVGEVIPATGLEVVVLGWKQVNTNNEMLAPDAGNMFVGVEVLLVNTGTESRAISSLSQMKLQDSRGREYKVDVKVNIILNSSPPEGRIMVGERLHGTVGFQVPLEATGLTFVFIDEPLINEAKALVELGNQPVRVAVPNNLPRENITPAYQLNEVAQLGDVVVTVNKVERIAANQTFKPEAGNEFIAVDLSIQNTGDRMVNLISISQMYIKDADGWLHEVDMHATLLAKGQLLDGKLKPSEKKRGRLGYQVPQDAQELMFTFSLDKGKVFVRLPIDRP